MNAAEQPDDLQTLAKGGRTSVTGFFIRLIARIPFLIIASRWYGAEELGRLAYAIAVIEFVAQITTLGLKRGLALHLTGVGKDNGAWDAILVILLATTVPTAILMAFPHILFPNSDLNPLDYLMPLSVPAIALTDIMLAALAFRLDLASTVRARAVVEPWTISLAALALWWSLPRDGMLVAYGLSMIAAMITALIPFLASYGLPKKWTPRGSELLALTARNIPLAVADAVEWGTRRLDVLILGLFVSPSVVGIYWVAQQVASLPQKLKTSFDPVLAPVITKKLTEGDLPAIADQLSKVGFWILAAQIGIGLALGIPGKAVMSIIGPARDFIGGNGALAFLLLAEVLASAAVVSEAALVYMAAKRNMMISLLVLGTQAGLSLTLVLFIKAQGYDQFFQAAGVAASLAIGLAMGSLIKSNLASRLLGARVSLWRWSLLPAICAAGALGLLLQHLPEWAAMAFGIPLILAAYCACAWTLAFSESDRKLFR